MTVDKHQRPAKAAPPPQCKFCGVEVSPESFVGEVFVCDECYNTRGSCCAEEVESRSSPTCYAEEFKDYLGFEDNEKPCEK